ncbi:MAG: M50 family metallopeptidase [Bacteroidota bacterium]|nr:M50 family metallopeptidase [Bacteroidota bacterium]
MNPRSRLVVIIVLLALSIMFWDAAVLTPVKLFVVVLHELSHALTAMLTGGSVEHITIDARIGGMAVTRGGWSWLVVSSGYIGSMLLGGAIFLFSLRRGSAVTAAAVIGAGLLVIAAFFVRNTFGLIFTVLSGAALLAAARWLPERWLSLTVQYLGAMSCLYALVDVKEDVLTLDHRVTDASILADMTGIPAIVWGVAWSAAALLVFALIMRAAWRSASTPSSTTI